MRRGLASSFTMMESGLTLSYVQLAVVFVVLLIAVTAEAQAPARPAAEGDWRLVVNFGLGMFAIATGLLPWIAPVGAATLARENGWGLLTITSHKALPLALEGLISVILVSLTGYAVHRLMHRFDTLWRVHKVHHSDAELDFSTGFRAHPIEAILSSAVITAMVVTVGLGPRAVAGSLILVQALDLLAHCNVKLPGPVDRALGLVFATPAMHARHHSTQRAEHDTNFGNGIIVWDRLFGTYSGRAAPSKLGVD